MYIPKHFDVNDTDEIYSFIEANAFGQLISSVKGKLFSTHLPFLLSEDKSSLSGHLALPNPQSSDIDGNEVLVTLQGPHAYISPSWYKSPGVPTWNYQAVHIYGTCHVIRDSERVAEIVNALTEKYESAFEQPWQTSYNPAMLRAIVGIEIAIDELECKYKLSQNRSSDDRSSVIEKLKASGEMSVARAIDNLEK